MDLWDDVPCIGLRKRFAQPTTNHVNAHACTGAGVS